MFEVPLSERKAMGYGKPVSVYLEIGRFTIGMNGKRVSRRIGALLAKTDWRIGGGGEGVFSGRRSG